MKEYLFSGKSEQEVLEDALKELGVREDEIIYKMKEQKSGLFKAKKIEMSLVKKEDIHNYIKEEILKLVTNMGFDVNIETKNREGVLHVTLYSDNNNLLIGRDGRNLQALSLVINQIVSAKLGFFYKFNLDVGEYKLKQQKHLERTVKDLAREVAKTKVDAKLDPMNSYQRRIVHSVLSENNKVYTESIGEEPNRYVVIKAKND